MTLLPRSQRLPSRLWWILSRAVVVGVLAVACSGPPENGASTPTMGAPPPAVLPLSPGAVAWHDWPPAWGGDRAVMVFLHTRRSYWCRDLVERCFSDPSLVVETERLTQPVSVDADERPDLAARYGLGAWPSLAFLTPEGTWITGTTYVEPDDYGRLLRRAGLYFEIPERRADLERNRRHLLRRRRQSSSTPAPQPTATLRRALAAAIADSAAADRMLSPEAFLFLVEARGPASLSHLALGPLLALADLSRDGSLRDEELHLAVASGRIAALARAGSLGRKPAWVNAARAGMDSLVTRLVRDDGLFAAGAASFVGPDTSGAYALRYEGAGPVDTRVFTGWNALAASALQAVGEATGETGYRDRARKVVDALTNERVDAQGRVLRGAGGELFFLEDAALLARASLDVGRPAEQTAAIVDRALVLFSSEDGGLRDRWPDEGPPVFLTVDREVPAPIGVFAQVLVRLAERTGDSTYAARAEHLIARFGAPALARADRSGALARALNPQLEASPYHRESN